MQNSNSADFTLRIRFRIPSRDRLGVDENEVVFTPDNGPEVTLKSADKENTIRESDWLIVQSSGWDSELAAKAAAKPLSDALCRALARWNMGADLGSRFPQGGFFRAGLKWLEERTGRPTLNDTHGPVVFATELHPVFARLGQITAYRTISDERWRDTFLFALECGSHLGDRERAAFDLYSVAHAVGDAADARFVLLFAAIETLLENRLRPGPIVHHIDQLIAFTNDADIEMDEKNSLVGSLKWLRSHSIRSSGRHLVRERLGGREYQDRSAEDVFLDCYDLRNRLLHGEQPLPTREEVSGLVSALDQIVSHLLAGPVLDFDAK